jgi:hypothetical protein
MAAFLDRTTVPLPASRLALLAERDTRSAALVQRLLRLPARVLPQARPAGQFAFSLSGRPAPDGGWAVRPSGMSRRYGAIIALGLLRLPEPDQRAVLGGEDCNELVGRMAETSWAGSCWPG